MGSCRGLSTTFAPVSLRRRLERHIKISRTLGLNPEPDKVRKLEELKSKKWWLR